MTAQCSRATWCDFLVRVWSRLLLRLQWIAATVVRMFADQIFRSGFIHGDPHPGMARLRKPCLCRQTAQRLKEAKAFERSTAESLKFFIAAQGTCLFGGTTAKRRSSAWIMVA